MYLKPSNTGWETASSNLMWSYLQFPKSPVLTLKWTPLKKPVIINLGVFFDSDLKCDNFLSPKDCEKVVNAFISSRLEYSNALYSGISLEYSDALYSGIRLASLSKQQVVQNTAARLLSLDQEFEHITPVWAAIHWLPEVQDWFKYFTVFKAMNGLPSAYISGLLTPYV